MQTIQLDIKKIQTMILEMRSNRERKIPRRRKKTRIQKDTEAKMKHHNEANK